MVAIRRVEDLSRDSRFVGYYDIEEANRQARIEFEQTGFRKGKEIGMKEVEKKKQLEIAKSLKEMGMSEIEIHKSTGLSLDDFK